MRGRVLSSLARRVGAFLLVLAVVRAVAPVAGAAPPPARDLGQGLAYYRMHELPADLPAMPAPRACVLDVRYVPVELQVATAFRAWLTFHAAPRAPIFVLANAGTGEALLAALGVGDQRSSFIVVGIAAGNFHPDLAVRASAADERRAYDAFEEGVALAALLADNPDKVRNDEASLSPDRLTEPGPRVAAKDGPAPPPVDAALQRAVHLHRALLALKKI